MKDLTARPDSSLDSDRACQPRLKSALQLGAAEEITAPRLCERPLFNRQSFDTAGVTPRRPTQGRRIFAKLPFTVKTDLRDLITLLACSPCPATRLARIHASSANDGPAKRSWVLYEKTTSQLGDCHWAVPACCGAQNPATCCHQCLWGYGAVTAG